MFFQDFVDIIKIRRALVYTALIGVTMLLQLYVFDRISFFGTRPMLAPLIAVGIGMFENGEWGGIAGLAAGILMDMAYTDSLVFFTIILTILGFLAGAAEKMFINRRLFSYVVASVIAVAAIGLLQGLRVWIYYDASVGALLATQLLQTLWTVPFAFPAYFAVKAASRGEKNGIR